MSPLLIVIALLSLSVAFPEPALGKERSGRPGRLQRQAKRTVQGVKSGALTKEEGKAIAGRNKAIRQQKKALLQENDGRLKPAQRKEIHQQLKAQSKAIYKEKHDGETRAPASQPPALPTNSTQVPQ